MLILISAFFMLQNDFHVILKRYLQGQATKAEEILIDSWYADLGKDKISRHIYGHFAEHLGHCIYGGFYVGDKNSKIPTTKGVRDDVVEALKKLKVPNLRWPGGCFADTYHWKDGIGPKDKRPSMVNKWWGGVTEDNSFGTHEFIGLCRTLGSEPYFAGNVGSGTPHELRDWIEYCNMPSGSALAGGLAAVPLAHGSLLSLSVATPRLSRATSRSRISIVRRACGGPS